MFQTTYIGFTAPSLKLNFRIKYVPSPEGVKVWSLVSQLDTTAPDRDSIRLGELGRRSMAADDLHKKAAKQGQLNLKSYQNQQAELYATALRLVNSAAPRRRRLITGGPQLAQDQINLAHPEIAPAQVV